MKKSKGRADAPPHKKGGVTIDMEEHVTVIIEELEDEDEECDVEIESGQLGGSYHQPSGLKVFDFETLAEIHKAHDKVASVLKEGTSNLPRAFTINLARDRQNLKDGIAGGVAAVAATLIGGDPVFGIIAAPLGFMVRNVWNTFRIRSRRDKLVKRDPKELESSEIPELKNAWDLTCYKFVRLVKGYNARVHAVNRIRENRRHDGGKELLRVAKEWDHLLREVYNRLQEVCSELQRHQGVLYSKLTKDLEELDDNLRSSDLLGYFDGVPLLDWLDIKEDRIMISQAQKVFRRDLEAREELRELNEHRKASFHDLDNFLKGTDPVFDELDKEHGEAVRAIMEEESLEDEDDDS